MPRTAAKKTAGKTTGRKTTATRDKPAPAARPVGTGGRARPIWSGTLSFGLISIPVALAPAIRDAEGRVAFHLLDSRDLKRVRRELYCPADEQVVDNPRDIARGVEVKPGQWVTVEDDELRAAAPKRSTSIEILDFVPLGEIDPLYYDHPYLVIPGGALKPYRLLVEVLDADNLAGIARFVLHAREHYVALRVLEDQLVLITLRYQDQLRTPEGLELDVKPEAREVKALLAAIGKLKDAFDPALLEDDTNEKVMALIEKLKSQATEAAAPKAAAKSGARKSAPQADLSAQLEASVAQARKSRGAAKAAGRATGRKPAAKSAARSGSAARRRKLKVVE